MIIAVCLLILLVLTMFSFILGNVLTGIVIDDTLSNDLIVNDTITTITFEESDALFSIDPILGAIGILIVIGIVGALVGVQIIGTGLSPESVKIVMSMIMYGGMWGVLSVLSLPLINSIEIFGVFIYISLTIAYVIGIIQKLGGGSE